MNLEDLDIGFLSFNLEYLNNTYYNLNNIEQNNFKNNILNDFKQNLNKYLKTKINTISK
jgi:hypothetical protein